MTTFSAHGAHTLIDDIKNLSQECQAKRATFNYHNTPEQKAQYFANYMGISKDCQALLVKAIDAFESFEAFYEWSRENDLNDQVLDVIAFAMTRESPHLTTLGWWMSPGLQNLHQKQKDWGDPLSKIKNLFNQLSNSYSSNEYEKYREPAFFINGQFREGFLHSEVFSRKVNHAMVNIIDDCVGKPQAARDWITRIHDLYQDCPTTGQVVKDVLKRLLMDEEVEGLTDLRDYILGQVMPKGEECSVRCKYIVERMFSTSREIDMACDTTVMLMNEHYAKHAFLMDFVGHVQRAQIDAWQEHDRTNEPPETKPNLKNFSKLYSLMGLDDEALCTIATLTAGQFSLGKLGDYANESVADRMKEAVACMKRSFSDGLELRWPNSAAMASVLLALSPSITAEVAQDNDINRSVIYTLTGNPAHLSNMKDSKRLDSHLGADLGL